MRSSGSSMPIDRRSRPWVIPRADSSASVRRWWVVVAGCRTSERVVAEVRHPGEQAQRIGEGARAVAPALHGEREHRALPAGQVPLGEA